jgi:hypothetical protein
LLVEFKVDPAAPMRILNKTEPGSKSDIVEDEAEIVESDTFITPLQLASARGDIRIVELLNVAIARSAAEAAEMEEGYSADLGEESASVHLKSRQYKSRLILGDGSFSFSRALLEKHQAAHPKLPSVVVVTEYDTEAHLKATYTGQNKKDAFENFEHNVEAIRKMGAEVVFNIDATRLAPLFPGRRFKRIHFNFPYVEVTDAHRAAGRSLGNGGASKLAQQDTRQLVANFFASASGVQHPGDRIHMALPKQPSDPAKEAWHQNVTYAIVEASKSAGYELISRRRFSDGAGKSSRYPGYRHVKTASSASTIIAEYGRGSTPKEGAL